MFVFIIIIMVDDDDDQCQINSFLMTLNMMDYDVCCVIHSIIWRIVVILIVQRMFGKEFNKVFFFFLGGGSVIFVSGLAHFLMSSVITLTVAAGELTLTNNCKQQLKYRCNAFDLLGFDLLVDKGKLVFLCANFINLVCRFKRFFDGSQSYTFVD
jgi:hypothetical protein